MSDQVRKALKEAIRRLHGCEGIFLETVPIHEATEEGETVWEGIVHVFDLPDCSKAPRVYAWSELTDEVTGRERFFAVLDRGKVDSPKAAVQASILQDVREQTLRYPLPRLREEER